MNNYITDGAVNLSRVSCLIKDNMTDEECERAILYFAIGVERISKGIVWSINPVLIFESKKLDDIVSELYLDRLTDEAKKTFNNGSKNRVISMKDSLFLAASFSDSIYKYKDSLHKLRDFRDILVHRTYSEIQFDESQVWLRGIYFPILEALISELSLDADLMFCQRKSDIEKLSVDAKHWEKINDTVTALLAEHSEKWESIKGDTAYVKEAKRLLELDLNQTREETYSNSYERYTCPACANDSVLELEVEVEGDQWDWHVNGPFAVNLRCHYCSLRIEDYEHMTFLGVENWWQQPDNET